MSRLLVLLVTCAALVGCAAPSDNDGEKAPSPGVAQGPAPAREPNRPATPVVVDTDLGGDDLMALAFLLQHPDVRVEAVTIAATGLVGCDAGVNVLAGLFAALPATPVPVACGRETAAAGGRPFPAAWREAAAAGTGIAPAAGSLAASSWTAPELIAQRSRTVQSLNVVALGPLTNLADFADAAPKDYSRLAGVLAMAGSVDGPLVDGVAEWNAAADPEALAAVLAGPAPLTVVPDDAIPSGTSDALRGPVAGRLVAAAAAPKWWDLAAAATLVAPDLGKTERGTWTLDRAEPGRLRRAGAGPVQVYRSLDAAALDAQYRAVFAAR